MMPVHAGRYRELADAQQADKVARRTAMQPHYEIRLECRDENLLVRHVVSGKSFLITQGRHRARIVKAFEVLSQGLRYAGNWSFARLTLYEWRNGRSRIAAATILRRIEHAA